MIFRPVPKTTFKKRPVCSYDGHRIRYVRSGPIQYEQNSGSVFLGRDYTNTQRNFSSEVAFEIDKAVREIIDTAHKQAIEILTEHKGEVTLIANTLLEKETITAEEIDSLIKTGKLPEKPSATVKEKETPEEKGVIDGKLSAEQQLKDEEKPVTPEAPQSSGRAQGRRSPERGPESRGQTGCSEEKRPLRKRSLRRREKITKEGREAFFLCLMKIGNVEVNGPVVLGPMAGVTTLAYREFMKPFGVALSFSEMISDCGIFYGNAETYTYLATSKIDHPVGLQLFGSNAEISVKAISILERRPIMISWTSIWVARFIRSRRPGPGAPGSSIRKNSIPICGDRHGFS
jgi:hypothetical protein